MILAITEHYHDYEPRIKYVDSDLLDASNPVDKEILAAVKKNKDYANVDASDWEENPAFTTEPGITSGAVLKKKPSSFDKALVLNIDFDC